MDTQLIRCGDGKLAPSSIVCKHLMDSTSEDWVQLEQPDGGETFDYICRDCFKSLLDLDPDNLMACCFHCVRERISESRGNIISMNDALEG